MVTNPEDLDPGLSREEQAEAFARNLIAGHPQGSVRRIALYCAAFMLVGLAPAFGTIAAVPALVVIALLAQTDSLA